MTTSQMPTRIPMPCPFAGGTDAALTSIDFVQGNTVNFKDGFPGVYGAPASSGGKYVSRGEMNAIGNLASNDLFYHKCGGLNTFDPVFCNAIGGYPRGAVLQVLNSGALWYVESLVDNNFVDFTLGGVDGVNWRYCYESKYASDEETKIGHVEITEEIIINSRYSQNLYIFRVPKSGLVTVRNVSFEISEEETCNLHPGLTTNEMYGDGIIAKKFSSSEIQSFIPFSRDETTPNGWVYIGNLAKGKAGIFTFSASWLPTSSYGWYSTELFVVPNGLISAQQGEYVAINCINAMQSYNEGGGSLPNNPTLTFYGYTITAMSFDIYII